VYESALSRQLKANNLAHSLSVPDEKIRLLQQEAKAAKKQNPLESSIAETRTRMGDDPSRLHESDYPVYKVEESPPKQEPGNLKNLSISEVSYLQNTTSHILDFDGKPPAQNKTEGVKSYVPTKDI